MNNRIQKTVDERKIGDTKVELLTFPIGQLFEEKEKINRKILNVIYILCMTERPIPRIPFKDLQKCTDKIVLLFSDEVAEWALDNNEKKIEIKRVAQTRFYKEYKKKNYNSFVKWRPDFDIPIKRSYALYDARKKNAEYIWLLDDDIIISQDNYFRAIRAMVGGKGIVGFHVTEYPDMSIMDHAKRIVDHHNARISMTGSCMFINVKKVRGYFPYVYNEDLFFFMQQPFQNVVSGGTIRQVERTSWTDFERIRHEQLGDFIYNVYKSRFLKLNTGMIDWKNEKKEQLEQLNRLYETVSDEMVKEAVRVAYEATKYIDIYEVEEFVNNCQFADWVYRL